MRPSCPVNEWFLGPAGRLMAENRHRFQSRSQFSPDFRGTERATQRFSVASRFAEGLSWQTAVGSYLTTLQRGKAC
jgi:hypothetical protein